MPISRRRGAALVVALLAAAAASAAPAGVAGLLAPAPAGSERTMSGDELGRLLAYGAAGGLTIFEVFDEAIVALAAEGQRAVITGDTLRAAAARYDLGGDRVAALLPEAKIARIVLGSSSPGSPGSLEVLLSEEHAQYLELADIRLSTRYGFRDVRAGEYRDGFGASVRRLVFSFNLDSLELYDRNKIAIHVRSFPQPKRWKIPKITAR
jgi:hypothetical protein